MMGTSSSSSTKSDERLPCSSITIQDNSSSTVSQTIRRGSGSNPESQLEKQLEQDDSHHEKERENDKKRINHGSRKRKEEKRRLWAKSRHKSRRRAM